MQSIIRKLAVPENEYNFTGQERFFSYTTQRWG